MLVCRKKKKKKEKNTRSGRQQVGTSGNPKHYNYKIKTIVATHITEYRISGAKTAVVNHRAP
jgi:hypothetical protein